MDQINPDELVQVLGIKPRERIWVGGNGRDARRLVEGVLVDRETVRPAEGAIDLAFITAEGADEALYFLGKLGDRLVEDAIVWIVMSECDGDSVANWSADVGVVDGWTATPPVRVVGGFGCVRLGRA